MHEELSKYQKLIDIVDNTIQQDLSIVYLLPGEKPPEGANVKKVRIGAKHDRKFDTKDVPKNKLFQWDKEHRRKLSQNNIKPNNTSSTQKSNASVQKSNLEKLRQANQQISRNKLFKVPKDIHKKFHDWLKGNGVKPEQIRNVFQKEPNKYKKALETYNKNYSETPPQNTPFNNLHYEDEFHNWLKENGKSDNVINKTKSGNPEIYQQQYDKYVKHFHKDEYNENSFRKHQTEINGVTSEYLDQLKQTDPDKYKRDLKKFIREQKIKSKSKEELDDLEAQFMLKEIQTKGINENMLKTQKEQMPDVYNQKLNDFIHQKVHYEDLMSVDEYKDYYKQHFSKVDVNIPDNANQYVLDEAKDWLHDAVKVLGEDLGGLKIDFSGGLPDEYGIVILSNGAGACYIRNTIHLPCDNRWDGQITENYNDESSYRPTTTSPYSKGIIWHEFGHYLTKKIFEKACRSNEGYGFSEIDLEDAYNVLSDEEKAQYDKLSKYATSSFGERYAETVSAMMTGSRSRYIPESIQAKFKDAFKLLTGNDMPVAEPKRPADDEIIINKTLEQDISKALKTRKEAYEKMFHGDENVALEQLPSKQLFSTGFDTRYADELVRRSVEDAVPEYGTYFVTGVAVSIAPYINALYEYNQRRMNDYNKGVKFKNGEKIPGRSNYIPPTFAKIASRNDKIIQIAKENMIKDYENKTMPKAIYDRLNDLYNYSDKSVSKDEFIKDRINNRDKATSLLIEQLISKQLNGKFFR